MREFRGKRKDNNEWAYGYYVKVMDREGDEVDLICSIDISYTRINGKWYLEDTTEVISETVGQFIKSVHGDEIYEGDIQRWLNPLKSKQEYAKNPYSYCEVKWNNRKAGFDCVDMGEVIGNIHQNPELIEEGK